MAEQLVDVDVAVNPPTSGSHVIMSRQIIISTFLLLLATQSSKHTGRQKVQRSTFAERSVNSPRT